MPVELAGRHAGADRLAASARACRRRPCRRAPSCRSRARDLRMIIAAASPSVKRRSARLDLRPDLVDRLRAVDRRRPCRARGTTRRAARSARGRCAAGSRSPRACRPCARALEHPLARDVVGHLEHDHGVEAAADLAQHRVERLGLRRACAGSRRGRSRRAASGSPSRSRISATTSSSGTRSPRSTIGFDLQAERRSRRRSRRGACRRWRCARGRTRSTMRVACVPLPAPCGPKIRRFTLFRGSLRSCASSSATPSGASCRARRRRRSAPRCRRARARSPARSRSS